MKDFLPSLNSHCELFQLEIAPCKKLFFCSRTSWTVGES